jgi:peroxiredoxin
MCWALMTATVLLVLAGCGSEASPSAGAVTTAGPTAKSASASTTRRGPQPVEIQYLLHITGGDGEGWERFNVVTDGGTRVRLKMSLYDDPGGTPGEEYLYTWDGRKLMVFSEQSEPPYTVFEAPGEHPDETQLVMQWQENLWSGTRDGQCTELKSPQMIIGRAAVGYRCVTPTPEPGQPAAGELWLDRATGILLKAEDLVAERLVLAPTIDATTFSTKPPSGAKSTVIAAKKAPPKKAPDFTLDLIKGGQIGLKDLVGKPFVLAFFMSDLAFDEQGEVCPGCRDALLTLQALTINGARPRVLGVQVGDLGKPGYPLAVPGVTLPLAHEQTPVVQNSFGLSGMVSFVFVGADGAIAATYDRAPTKQQITQSLAALD